MVMWIILGVLVFAVIAFLVITSILDRKKRKREKHTILKKEQEAYDAIGQVAAWINLVILESQKKLNTFVASVGEFKMSQLNKTAEEQLRVIKNSSLFKKISGDEDLNKDFTTNIEKLISTKANNWSKQCYISINFFKNAEGKAESENKDRLNQFKSEQQKYIAQKFMFQSQTLIDENQKVDNLQLKNEIPNLQLKTKNKKPKTNFFSNLFYSEKNKPGIKK